MKKIYFVAALFAAMTSFGQTGPKTTINMVGGARFSNFVFHDSQNNKEKNMNFRINQVVGANVEINMNKHIIRPELVYHQSGAKYKLSGTQLNWKLNYFAFNLGYLYSAVENKVFSLQPGLAFGVNYLLGGEQIMGSTRLDVIKENSFKRLDVEASGLLNAKIQVTPLFSVGVEYRFGYGLLQIEKDANQKTRNISHSALVNFGFTIAKNTVARY